MSNEKISKKVALLGMWGVGKTSLVRKFVDNVFDDKYLSTLGVKVDKKVIDADGKDLTLVIWDIAGAEDNFSVPMHYVKGAAAYLMVIDGTRKETLDKALDLIKEIEQQIGLKQFVAVVNKSDLDWELDDASIESALAPLTKHWFYSSAKTGENVENAFRALALKAIDG